jgi:hypothetical protein
LIAPDSTGQTNMGDSKFQCAQCGKQYSWRPQLAGRSVKCACGAVFKAPAQPMDAEEDLYAIATAPDAAAAPQPVLPTAAPVLPYRGRSPAASPPVDDYFPDKIKDLQMPLVLLVAGLIVEFAAGWWSSGLDASRMLLVLSWVGINVVVGTALTLLGIFIAAKLRGIEMGRFWTAVLKLSAIVVAPSAVMTVLYLFLRFLPLGGLLVAVLGFCFYFALIGALFDLDQGDTWYCVCVIFLLKLAIYLAGVYWLAH